MKHLEYAHKCFHGNFDTDTTAQILINRRKMESNTHADDVKMRFNKLSWSTAHRI